MSEGDRPEIFSESDHVLKSDHVFKSKIPN